MPEISSIHLTLTVLTFKQRRRNNFKLHSPTKSGSSRTGSEKENIDLIMLLMPVRLNT